MFWNLGLMMFMQYLLLAVWWIPLAAYLANIGLSGTQKVLILSSMAVGSLASPFIGKLSDRYFSGKKVLAVLNAQGFLAFAIWGVGLFVGIIFNGWLIDFLNSEKVANITYNRELIFATSLGLSITALIIFLFLFKENRTKKEQINFNYE